EHHQRREESRQCEEILRLGADAGRAEDRWRPQELSGTVQSIGSCAARRTEDGRNQADQLRLREVRQRSGAQAAAGEVGPRGVRDTALSRAAIVAKTAPSRVGAASTRTKGEIRGDSVARALRARRYLGCVPGVWSRRTAKAAQSALYCSIAMV